MVEFTSATAGAVIYLLSNTHTWSWYHFIGWSIFIMVALEVLAKLTVWLPPILCPRQSSPSAYIPVRGRPLEKFNSTDIMWSSTTKMGTAIFSYHALHYCNTNSNVKWLLADWDIINGVLAVPIFFMGYDFTYYWFHRLLHTNAFYGWVHKHHHRQMAPFRGNADAINIHPVEMIGGEWNHLLWMHIAAVCLPTGIHIIGVLFFIVTGGIMASLNHTRYDLRLPFLPSLWQVRFHDVHHWAPKTNYAQYTLFWDHVFGSFKAHPDEPHGVPVIVATATATTATTKLQ